MIRSVRSGHREYRFGDLRFVPDRQLLLRGDVPVRIGSRALELLRLLVSRPGEIVSKTELTKAAWPSTHVHESNLKVTIAALRRALAPAPSAPSYIATVPGRGYRFVGEVSVVSAAGQAAAKGGSGQSGELPAIPALIGRQEAVSALADALRAGGMATVVGPPGVGKTTVAVAAARRVAPRYRSGVRFVDLAVVGEPPLVGSAIASALGIDGEFTDILAALVDALHDKQMLLLLDNCEHLLSAVTTVAEYLRSRVPDIHLLATSREALRSRDGIVHRLAPLSTPQAGAISSAAQALAFPAVELFVRRAEATHGYRFQDADAAAVAKICRQLDGLPLAIELAAARLQVGDPAKLLQLLDADISPLHAAGRTEVPRHRTLTAMLDWSYRLLSEAEARLFRTLSVFSGGFSLEDIVGIAAGVEDDAEEVARLTASLAARSLLSMSYQQGTLRYRLLESTRCFAVDALCAHGEETESHRRHARYMLAVFERTDAAWTWRDRDDWTASHAPRANDLRKALDWAFGERGDADLGVRLTVAAIPFWDELSMVRESWLRVGQALRAEAPARSDIGLRMKLAASFASGLNFSDHLGAEADSAWREAFCLAFQVGSADYQLRALWGAAVLQSFSGRHREALDTLERFQIIAAREGERSAEPDGERLRLMTRFYCGEIAPARDGLEALERAHGMDQARSRIARFQIDRPVGIRVALASVRWVQGDHRAALAALEGALARAQGLGHLVSQSNALAQAGLPLALHMGDLNLARRYAAMLAHNLHLREIAIWRPVAGFYDAAIAGAQGDVRAATAMHRAVETLVANNFLVRVPIYLAMTADVALRFGQLDLARRCVADALERATLQNERWCQPELLRVQGALQWRAGDLPGAEQTLSMAVDQARESGALSFELRAATTLAGLLSRTGRSAEARGLLAPVHDRFEVGFASADVARAAQLLSELGRTGSQTPARPRDRTGTASGAA